MIRGAAACRGERFDFRSSNVTQHQRHLDEWMRFVVTGPVGACRVGSPKCTRTMDSRRGRRPHSLRTNGQTRTDRHAASVIHRPGFDFLARLGKDHPPPSGSGFVAVFCCGTRGHRVCAQAAEAGTRSGSLCSNHPNSQRVGQRTHSQSLCSLILPRPAATDMPLLIDSVERSTMSDSFAPATAGCKPSFSSHRPGFQAKCLLEARTRSIERLLSGIRLLVEVANLRFLCFPCSGSNARAAMDGSVGRDDESFTTC